MLCDLWQGYDEDGNTLESNFMVIPSLHPVSTLYSTLLRFAQVISYSAFSVDLHWQR